MQFATNVPVPVVLAYDDGREVEGKFGTQVMYSLEGGRVMYVPPVVQEQIRKLGIRKGEEFYITKSEVKNGTRRTIHWIVDANDSSEPLAAEPEPPVAQAASSPPPRAAAASVVPNGVAATPARSAGPANGNSSLPANGAGNGHSRQEVLLQSIVVIANSDQIDKLGVVAHRSIPV
jgi:hypothetical protein